MGNKLHPNYYMKFKTDNLPEQVARCPMSLDGILHMVKRELECWNEVEVTITKKMLPLGSQDEQDNTKVLLDDMWRKISREDKIPTSNKKRPVIRIEDKQKDVVIYLPASIFDDICDKR